MMWATDPVPEDDPLRQGDLLESVGFPMMKMPVVSFAFEGSEATTIAIKRKWGLVVSQCCENAENNDYVSIAHVTPIGGMTAKQEAAFLQREPRSDSAQGYSVTKFYLEPLPDLIPVKANQHLQADLLRAQTFWGDMSHFRAIRRSRMTPVGRRWLRINLELLWGRPEGEDASWLTANGFPLGVYPTDEDVDP